MYVYWFIYDLCKNCQSPCTSPPKMHHKPLAPHFFLGPSPRGAIYSLNGKMYKVPPNPKYSKLYSTRSTPSHRRQWSLSFDRTMLPYHGVVAENAWTPSFVIQAEPQRGVLIIREDWWDTLSSSRGLRRMEAFLGYWKFVTRLPIEDIRTLQ